jgi:predicted metal-dependent HD superfamily phosphohydrolase
MYFLHQWRDIHIELCLPFNWPLFHKVVAAYSEKNRFYHDLSHLRLGFETIDILGSSLTEKERSILKLAFFLHDYLMGPGGEEKSAEALMAHSRMTRPVGLVLGTKDHQNYVSGDPLWPFMNDADLAIFSKPLETYQKYSGDIWKEYSHYGREAFVIGRSTFLKNFKKNPIFNVMTKMNDQAIFNIEWELDFLNG